MGGHFPGLFQNLPQRRAGFMENGDETGLSKPRRNAPVFLCGGFVVKPFCLSSWKVGLGLLAFVAWCGAGCSPKSEPSCTNLSDSTEFMERHLEAFAVELERHPDPEAALSRLEAVHRLHASQLETCGGIVAEAFRQMSPEAVMRHHEVFIGDARVRRFLDAQDRFNESAPAPLVERLDDLLDPLFLLSE